MFLANFCKNVYGSCPKITNHENFIEGLFVASGSKSYISVSYKRNLFNGDKEFIEKKKDELRGYDNKESLTSFFFESIADDMVAMACQEEKSKCLINSDEQETFRPTYRGDSVFVSSGSRHEIGVHDFVEHTWEIHNTGKVQWINRKMVYMRGPKDRPEANPSVVDIPDVLPNQSIKITTTFDGRGFEGITYCRWEMQDEDGDNCFPNQESKFSVTIDAKFKRN